jgi:DNA replication protein DnaC
MKNIVFNLARIYGQRVTENVANGILADGRVIFAIELLEDRYGRKSIIITSQLPVAKWYEYINDPTLADAILDRLTSDAHRIELKGESLRRKKVKSYQ